MAATLLDVQNLNCPMPVLKARKAMGELKPGDRLEVLATDPGSVSDFRALCAVTKHKLVEVTETGGVYRFVIEIA
jgi:tRNA 2-thiouridine synthesizing protein A